jgi:hypothetical protein
MGLGGFYGSGGEVMLAGGDLDPDVDGSDLAFPITEFWALRAGNGRKAAEQVFPGGPVDGPGFQGSAPFPVVDETGGRLVGFGGQGMEG